MERRKSKRHDTHNLYASPETDGKCTLTTFIQDPARLKQFNLSDPQNLERLINDPEWNQSNCEALLFACARKTPSLLPRPHIKNIGATWQQAETAADWDRQDHLVKFILFTAQICMKWDTAKDDTILIDYYDEVGHNPFFSYFLTPLHHLGIATAKATLELASFAIVGGAAGAFAGDIVWQEKVPGEPSSTGSGWSTIISVGGAVGTALFGMRETLVNAYSALPYHRKAAEEGLAAHIEQQAQPLARLKRRANR